MTLPQCGLGHHFTQAWVSSDCCFAFAVPKSSPHNPPHCHILTFLCCTSVFDGTVSSLDHSFCRMPCGSSPKHSCTLGCLCTNQMPDARRRSRCSEGRTGTVGGLLCISDLWTDVEHGRFQFMQILTIHSHGH